MSEWTEKVIKFYADTGIGMDLEGNLPDHLSIELKFMSLLCYRERDLWGKEETDAAFSTLKKEEDFLEYHLLRWAPDYLGKMQKEANTEFYRGIALLTKNFLNYDKKIIEQICNPLSYPPCGED